MKDNVHWLRATTETAFTFDVLVLDLKGKPWDVDNIDPEGAEKVSGNLLRVRKLDVDTALRKYGHDTHHGEIHKTELLRRGGAEEPRFTRPG